VKLGRKPALTSHERREAKQRQDAGKRAHRSTGGRPSVRRAALCSIRLPVPARHWQPPSNSDAGLSASRSTRGTTARRQPTQVVQP
jgi:hypothetical protein